VVAVFVIEGGLIGMLGAALGLFLGFMTCFAAEHFGIRMNPEVYYIDRLPVHIDFTEFALTGIAAVLVCLAITVYPALLASRLRPVDALRYE
jgi:lipoprotein-releasing system permease protein